MFVGERPLCIKEPIWIGFFLMCPILTSNCVTRIGRKHSDSNCIRSYIRYVVLMLDVTDGTRVLHSPLPLKIQTVIR